MKDRNSKIYGLVLFLLLAAAIIYFTIIASGNKQADEYESIKINGTSMLPAEDYLYFTGLSDTSKLKNITLTEVKQLFENHPYINKAEVEFDGINSIKVQLYEKDFKALIINRDKLLLVSEICDFQPVLKNTAFETLPILSNVRLQDNNELEEKNHDTETGVLIIEAIKLMDGSIYKSLAEVNLNNGGDIVLTFTNTLPPVIFGKGNTPYKIAELKAVWNDAAAKKDYLINSTYIDLRYDKKIFIGKSINTEITG